MISVAIVFLELLQRKPCAIRYVDINMVCKYDEVVVNELLEKTSFKFIARNDEVSDLNEG